VGEKYCLRKTFDSNGRKGVTKVDKVYVFVIRKKKGYCQHIKHKKIKVGIQVN
jgi:hypothetical protein